MKKTIFFDFFLMKSLSYLLVVVWVLLDKVIAVFILDVKQHFTYKNFFGEIRGDYYVIAVIAKPTSCYINSIILTISMGKG